MSSFLSPTGRKLWKDRASKKWLVLVDELEASGSDSPIMALRDALIKVDVTSTVTFASLQGHSQLFNVHEKSGRAWYVMAHE